MLLFGSMLGCLDPVLTIAAAMGHGRPIFLTPAPAQQQEVAAARRGLLTHALQARSDHVALVAAFNEWARRRAAGGRGERRALRGPCAPCWALHLARR